PPGPVAARKLSLSASSGIRISSGDIGPPAESVGKRSGHGDRRLPVTRNDETRGMKQHWAARHTVHPVARDPAAERLTRVRADLVRPSRQGTKLDQSGAVSDSNPPPVRCCGEAML